MEGVAAVAVAGPETVVPMEEAEAVAMEEMVATAVDWAVVVAAAEPLAASGSQEAFVIVPDVAVEAADSAEKVETEELASAVLSEAVKGDRLAAIDFGFLEASAIAADVADDCFVRVEMAESCPAVLSEVAKGYPSPDDSGVADDCFVRVARAELSLVVLLEAAKGHQSAATDSRASAVDLDVPADCFLLVEMA